MLMKLTRGLAVLAMALTIAVPAWAQTQTVSDALDRKVEVPANPSRILLGFYFEDFFAIGGKDAYEKVVGLSRAPWEGWRNLQWKAYVKAVPKIAELADVGEVDAGTFSLEKAVSIKPDVAILAAWQFNALGDVVQRIESAGIPVIVLDYNAQTVEKHVKSTLALGAILGTQERAQKLADAYSTAVADVESRIASIKDKPKVYVELGRKGAEVIDNSYGDTMWGRLIVTAGGINIAKNQVAKWAPLSPEHVLAQNPDAIFLAGSGWVSRDKAVLMGPGVDTALTHERMKPYSSRAGWNGLNAIKKQNIHAIYHGGARTLYDFVFLQYLAKTFHPSAFEDVDPQANLDKFFADYMPIQFSGTYMTRLPGHDG